MTVLVSGPLKGALRIRATYLVYGGTMAAFDPGVESAVQPKRNRGMPQACDVAYTRTWQIHLIDIQGTSEKPGCADTQAA